MDEFKLKRSDVQEKLKELTLVSKNKSVVREAVRIWLEQNNCSELETRQILNDLTSYSDYLNLVN